MPAGVSRRRNGAPSGVRQLEHLAELVRRDLAELGERLADEQLGGIVEVDQRSSRVHEEHRRREVRRELAREDEGQALRRVAAGRHAHGR